MSIELVGEDKATGRVSFLLKSASPAIANALRRAIMEEVPTMAIDEVEFRKNSSVHYDELLAHRLGLIPLKTDLKSYVERSKCKCEGAGCARCTLKLSLKAKGPGIVYAKELKSADPKVKPAHPDMPIAHLLKGQELELEATAVLGYGKDHVKWTPALAYYRYKPIITIDDKKCTNAEATAKSCPVDVYDVKDSKLVINKQNHLRCHLCMACVDIAANNSVQVTGDPAEFLFFVEPWGQLSAKEAVTAAADIILGKLEDFEKKIAG